MLENKKTVLIIGASGGISSVTVEMLLKKGWHVFATDKQIQKDTKREDKSIEWIDLDITNAHSVDRAYEIISQKTNGLDAIVHMAGTLSIGSLIEVPIEHMQHALEINLLGIYRVNQCFLPLLLKRKGRIIHLSSEVGIQAAAPFNGIYAITKHALEAYSDALRRELMFLGVKVIKIQPGPIKTEMTKSGEALFEKAAHESKYFKRQLNKGLAYLPAVYRRAHEPEVVAEVIARALIHESPKIAYQVVIDKTRMLLDILPTKWSDKLIAYFLS
ncbi:MAG: SDR family NAD(P)-dependent oxidoreductase [Chitinophagales bacterium]|nr:SDR family NAD(P)-dependent oxidoreductase [Chitinophagales bacterium]